jgi:hypothetical protein
VPLINVSPPPPKNTHTAAPACCLPLKALCCHAVCVEHECAVLVIDALAALLQRLSNLHTHARVGVGLGVDKKELTVCGGGGEAKFDTRLVSKQYCKMHTCKISLPTQLTLTALLNDSATGSRAHMSQIGGLGLTQQMAEWCSPFKGSTTTQPQRMRKLTASRSARWHSSLTAPRAACI